MLKMIVKMPLLPSVARCAGILMIRIDRVRVLIAIIGMQVSAMRMLICESKLSCSRVDNDDCQVFSNACRRPRLSSLCRRF